MAKIRHPLNGAGVITSHYGWRGNAFHQGLDLGVPGNKPGTPVFAILPGKVTKFINNCPKDGYLGNPCGGHYGNFVELEHKNGWLSRYAHLQDVFVRRVGQKIDTVRPLGTMGNSGSSTATHLHLEIIQDGKAIDPLPYVQAATNEAYYKKITNWAILGGGIALGGGLMLYAFLKA